MLFNLFYHHNIFLGNLSASNMKQGKLMEKSWNEAKQKRRKEEIKRARSMNKKKKREKR